MIYIQKNYSSQYQVDTELIMIGIQTALDLHQKNEVEIVLRLTDNEEITMLNHQYRNLSEPTDVLSFNHDFINPETNRLYLGDIIISLEMAKKQAQEHNHSLTDECMILSIHGTLHLLGYDHYLKKEEKEMWSMQEKIQQVLKKKFQERSL
jgi:probable rRNA maturation factor